MTAIFNSELRMDNFSDPTEVDHKATQDSKTIMVGDWLYQKPYWGIDGVTSGSMIRMQNNLAKLVTTKGISGHTRKLLYKLELIINELRNLKKFCKI